MTGKSRVSLHTGAAALIAAALVVAGAGAAYVVLRSRPEPPNITASQPDSEMSGRAPSDAAAAAGSSGLAAPLPDVVVSLTPDAVERAGIVVASVTTKESASDHRLPGVVEPNAYRRVAVTPLVAGRLTAVSVALGDRVRRGQALAQIYSPELAEAQTKYASAKAMLDAHDRELQRTEKLVEIGAASRQELERVHAEHAAQAAAVQSAQSQLELLGVPASTIAALGSGSVVNATITVPAPIDGVVTERAANVGLNVDQGASLFTVVDLSTVWVVADVYERDFSRVRLGSAATVTASAYPELSLRGRIDYIDPQVSSETRTAKVRVEVPNPRGELRLGMYADVVVTGPSAGSVLVIPRSAVQNVGDRTVVYLVNSTAPGRLTEREVRLGQASGEQMEVLSGLQRGDLVVTDGSFFVRAERERLGLRPATAPPAPSVTARPPQPAAGIQRANVVVNEQGFVPATVTVRAGIVAHLTFLRTTDSTCATEVVFPSLKITRTLPLNEPVNVEFTPERTGEITFACGMNMFRGAVAVQ